MISGGVQKTRSSQLRVLWDLMEGQRLRYFGAIAAMFVGVALSFLVPWICQGMLDSVISGKPLQAPEFVHQAVAALGGESVLARNIWIASGLILLVTAISGVFMYRKAEQAAAASEAIALRLRDRLYDQLQHATCAYHDKSSTGDLVQRCTSDVETVRAFLATQVVEISRALVLVVTVLPIMLLMSPRMALVSLAIIPPIVWFSIYYFSRIKSAFMLSDEAEGKMTAKLQENLTGIRVVRAFSRQEFECEKFSGKNADYRDTTFNLLKLLAWYWSASDFMCFVQKGLVLFAGAYWIGTGDLTIGKLFAFIVYVNMFLWPVRNMGRILTDTGKTFVSLDRLKEILDQQREEPVNVGVPVLNADSKIAGHVAFKNVSFAHTAEKSVLNNVSFSIEAGKTLAIVGPSGSGKSTLMNLLLRLYKLEHGTISIDGRDVREMDLKFLRRQVGIVMQEPFLFSKSLRDNLKLGRMQAQDQEMFEATQAACIHEGIQGFEKGYDTVVGERGVTLSGGQRQRVALARAILKDPAILVLDDALSAVDTETESMILNALKSRGGRHTTLVIAHRLSTLMQADKIIVLEDGKVTQTGTHASLLEQDGLYRRLWRIQASLEDDLNKEMSRDDGNVLVDSTVMRLKTS